jgi:hypothetical protein
MLDLLLLPLSVQTVVGAGFPVRAIVIGIAEIFAICFFCWLLAYWMLSQIPAPAPPFSILIQVLRVIIVVVACVWIVMILLGLLGVSMGG